MTVPVKEWLIDCHLPQIYNLIVESPEHLIVEKLRVAGSVAATPIGKSLFGLVEDQVHEIIRENPFLVYIEKRYLHTYTSLLDYAVDKDIHFKIGKKFQQEELWEKHRSDLKAALRDQKKIEEILTT